MRNAVVPFDNDFEDDAAPAPRKTPRKPRAGAGKRSKKGKRFSFDMKKMARFSAFGMSAAIVGGIMVNALMMQKGRHPAPLFGKAIPLGQPDTVTRPAPVKAAEAPAPKATEPDATASIPDPEPAQNQHHSDAAKVSNDPIARLIGGERAVLPPPSDKTVLGVQRALVKLGLMTKATGTMGQVTKKAIAKFEKDRHMAINGEVNHHLVKVLSTESGMKID